MHRAISDSEIQENLFTDGLLRRNKSENLDQVRLYITITKSSQTTVREI